MKSKWRIENNIWLVFASILSAFLNMGMACSQETFDGSVAQVLELVDAETITLDMIDGALPRLTEDTVVFRLRSGDPDVLRGFRIEEEDSLKDCIMIGAYFTAARWEWALFLKRKKAGTSLRKDKKEMSKLINGLRFAMEGYLHEVNHRLLKLAAPQQVLRDVDSLKRNFLASGDEFASKDFAKIDHSLEQVGKGIHSFVLKHDRFNMSFGFGEWLVWEAELSNLYLKSSGDSAKYFMRVMNHSYRSVDLRALTEFSSQLFGETETSLSDDFNASLATLEGFFLLKSSHDVFGVQSEVESIFDLLDLKFPSLD